MIAPYRKFAVALATALASLGALGLVDGTAEKWTVVVLNFLGALGVFAVPNQRRPRPGP